MIQEAIEDDLNFGWIAFDSFYGGNSELLRNVDDSGRCFTADVRKDQHIYPKEPDVYQPGCKTGVESKSGKLRARSKSVTIASFFKGISKQEWVDDFRFLRHFP